jgi:membrane associated rhomboid family serine protease
MSNARTMWDDFKLQINSGGVITWFVIVNVAVFVLLNMLILGALIATGNRAGAYGVLDDVLQWIGLNWDWHVFVKRPWTFITSAFAQYDFMHLFFNMVLFYWLADIIKGFVGERHIMPIFLYGSFSGGVVFIIIKNLVNVIGPGIEPNIAIGASGGVLAIVVAAATLVPNLPVRVLFIGDVALKYFAMVLVGLDLLLMHDGNAGGHFAHLGGALLGFIYIKQLQVGHNWSNPFHNVLAFVTRPFKKTPKGPRVVYKREVATNTAAKNKNTAPDQARIDDILDKINQSGYDSLTKDEKAFLFRYSNKD